jgi:DnaJ family protein C protein 8
MSPSSTDTAAEPSASNTDLERLLNREASAIQRELEVERILNAFKLKYVFTPHSCYPLSHDTTGSPYDILDLGPSATADDVKKKYRQLSLCELAFFNKTRGIISLMRESLYVLNG